MLVIENLRTNYGAIEALKGISLDVQEGEIVTLIGANGAGKSTTLMSISGAVPAQSGRIIFDGEDITKLPAHEIVRRKIAQAPEGRRIFPRMTVEENLMLGAMTADPQNYDRNRDEVFELFPRLKERRSQRGGTLSGGEQQMLAIGRALMSEPRLLILDEPSLGLAPMIVRQIFEIIAKVNKERGLTVFMVEQNANQALKIAHRAHVLVTGEITLSGKGAELRANEEVRAAYLEGH